MSDLTEFLLARVAEDEAAVFAWDSDGRAVVATMWTGGDPGYTTVATGHGDGVWIADGHEVDDPRHIRMLFDPARVLADCAAKRLVVAVHRMVGRGSEILGVWMECEADGIEDFMGPCPTLRALALPYADHADYRQEWRP